jgi:hypothetical protein
MTARMQKSSEPPSAGASTSYAWLWPTLLIATCLWLLYIEVDSAAFQQCVADHRSTYPEEASKENPAYFIAAASFWRVKIWTSCTGVFIDAYREAVTAVATIVIAIFTWTLWWSTKRLAEFARDQADDTKQSLRIADTAAQAAFISAEATEVLSNTAKHLLENERAALDIAKNAAAAAISQAETARAAIRPWVFAHPWPGTAEKAGEEILFQMYLRCHGNGPATVTSIGVQWSATPPADDTPLDTVVEAATNIGLAPDNTWHHPEMRTDFYRMPMDRPFVFGYVRYRDQAETYISRFTVRLHVTETGQIAMATAGSPAWSRFT